LFEREQQASRRGSCQIRGRGNVAHTQRQMRQRKSADHVQPTRESLNEIWFCPFCDHDNAFPFHPDISPMKATIE
jgi:hypothetical protein